MIINNGKIFLYEKGGLNFECRSQFIVDEDGRGFHCILVNNDLDKSETIQTEKDGKLKHQRPDISNYAAETYLNEQQRN